MHCSHQRWYFVRSAKSCRRCIFYIDFFCPFKARVLPNWTRNLSPWNIGQLRSPDLYIMSSSLALASNRFRTWTPKYNNDISLMIKQCFISGSGLTKSFAELCHTKSPYIFSLRISLSLFSFHSFPLYIPSLSPSLSPSTVWRDVYHLEIYIYKLYRYCYSKLHNSFARTDFCLPIFFFFCFQ